jgi:LacI family transcriptional regulator
MIGVIVPDISNPYFSGISKGIEDVVGQEGFQLMFCSSDEKPDKESRLLQLLNEKRVDAIVLATAGGNAEEVQRFIHGGTPIILIDRKLDQVDSEQSIDLVAEDNMTGAYLLTRKLLDDGHTNISIVNGPSHISTGHERYMGVLQAMEEAGLKSVPQVYNGDFSVEGGIRAVQQFISAEEKSTAIVSLNNRMTFGVLLELIRNGYRIPDDMAVASFGEVEAGQLLKQPGLYYIDQQPYEMGVTTGELLLKRIRKEEGSLSPVIEIFHNDVKQIQ